MSILLVEAMKKIAWALVAIASSWGCTRQEAEDFNHWPPQGWSVHDGGSGAASSWQHSRNPQKEDSQSDLVAYLNKEYIPDGIHARDWLVTPPHLVKEGQVLSFSSRLALDGNQGSIYKILVLADGLDPENLENYVSIKQWSEHEINPIQRKETTQEVAIPAKFAGKEIRIAFYMEGKSAEGWFVDAVKL